MSTSSTFSLADVRSARARTARLRSVLNRFLLLVPSVLILMVLAGTRVDAQRAPAIIPSQAVVTAWRLRADPVFANVVLPRRYPYARLISRVAKRYGLPADLIAGVVYVESRFNPRTVSPRGAVGLMQLLPSTARPLAHRLGLRHYDLFDPATNLELGAFFLKDRIDEYDGDIAMALSYYNGGRWGIVSRGRFRNRGYIRSVMQHYRRFDSHSVVLVAMTRSARSIDSRSAVTVL